MNIKRGLKIMLLCLMGLLMNFKSVNAALFTVRASKSSVAPGGSFTVSISVGGAGQFNVSASNGSVSSSSLWVDGNGSVTVTAESSGTVKVTVSAIDVTASDESPVTGSKTVSVAIKSSSNNSSDNTRPGTSDDKNNHQNKSTTSESTKKAINSEQEKRSQDNNLSSLTISNGTLLPEFSSKVTTYKVDLTSDVKKITVNAKTKDLKASVSGTGEHELRVGENNLVVTVKAENGSKKTYTISAYVTEKYATEKYATEKPSQYIKKGNQEYGILIDLSKADLPKGFEKTTLTVDGKEVTGLKNEKLGMTLLYLQDSEQKTGFYVYENDEIIGEYKTLSVNGKTYVILDANVDLDTVKDLKKGTVKIGETELDCWLFEDKEHADYSIIYLMNDAGEKNLYSYESTEGILQKYVPQTQKSGADMMTYVFIGTTALFAVSTATITYLYMSFKKKSILAVKEFYQNHE